MTSRIAPPLVVLLAAACGSGTAPAAAPAPAAPAPSEPLATEPPSPRANIPQLYVTADALHVTAGTYRYRLDRCAGDYDGPALSTLLGELVRRIDTSRLEVSADARASITYADLVLVMDAAIGAGASDVGLMPDIGEAWRVSGRASNETCGQLTDVDLPGAVEPLDPDRRPSVVLRGPSQPAGPGRSLDDLLRPEPSPAPAADEQPLVVVVTADEILVDGTGVGAAAVAGDRMPALAAVFAGQPRSRVIILQADRRTPAATIFAIVATASDAGLYQILFAVQRP